ncbi:MAG: glutamine amidotransferase subunit PdxT [Candidatus Fraserbacteria bacterium RBG_16_55_9]|uniref:Pyridoxal 5'-phosphate synthase subunit PdxT n=1 Tax=Fraserbacteria sp. (strain RBG_16_55_9) TaxID=1817864 RepID=A0A1F5V2N5_FRAXR|nr:MAG: glutamine amidotransferase subunit PdxT [Candidatus Fraserbacteria bacterium RBG_16_55_9]
MKVGVLGLQGDFREHLQVLKRLDVEARDVRTTKDLAEVNALILPGGESTTMVHLMAQDGLDQAIKERHRKGMPLYGTCAGMILLAQEIVDSKLRGLGLIDIAVSRNAYGRQVDSFEADLQIKNIGAFHAVFIRAPKIIRRSSSVEALAEHEGAPVLARQGHVLVSSFHPELTNDTRIHEYFLSMVD